MMIHTPRAVPGLPRLIPYDGRRRPGISPKNKRAKNGCNGASGREHTNDAPGDTLSPHQKFRLWLLFPFN